jgi:hypothetical protein
MLNKQAIYRKTPKGAEAMANRQVGLAPKLRSLLIMVDGKRGYVELTALASVVGDCEQWLSQLADDGLIEPITGAALAAPASAAAATPAPSIAATLPEARRFASRFLTEMLGPSSEVLCMKIESAANLADFVVAVKRARDTVRDVKGAQAAERFVAQVELHTPLA